MKRYVLGFAFDSTLSTVLLMEKNRPKWQAGKLNGVGGKIEPNESALFAMVREFEEETGVYHEDWFHVLTLQFPYAQIEAFTCADTEIFYSARTTTDEELKYRAVSLITECRYNGDGYNVLPNVPPLLELCKLRLTDREEEV